MPVQLSCEMSTTLVPPRALKQIQNRINRNTGNRYVRGVLPSRFDHRLYKELGGFAHKRGQKYTERKLKQYGHDLPNRLTGRLAQRFPASAAITATASGGRVKLRAYWAGKAKKKKGGKGFAKQGMPEWQRQEFETLSDRERRDLVKRQREEFLDLIEDPKYSRKRAVRRGR